MSALSKITPIYLSLLLAHFIFSFLNTIIWLSKIKSGIYTLPIDKIPLVNIFFKTPLIFETWWGFTMAAWTFNVPGYIVATVIVALAYKTSVDNYGVLYPAFVVGQITPLLTSMFFLYFKVGEFPNKQEWFALSLILMASAILANSR